MTVPARTPGGSTSSPNRLPHARTKNQTKATTGRSPVRAKIITSSIPQVAKMLETLQSPRLRSYRTQGNYAQTCTAFMKFIKNKVPPSDSATRGYFTDCRTRGVGERSLRTAFFQLKYFFWANGWPFNFDKRSAPHSSTKPKQPSHTIQEVEQLIAARDLYTPTEKALLALATTWASRREELARFHWRDLRDDVITLHIAKRDVDVDHFIPPAIRPFLAAEHFTPMTATNVSYIYHRICLKAGVKNGPGWGFHSIRRMVKTALEWGLAANGLPLSWAAVYIAWAATSIGREYSGSSMAGLYDHSADATTDPWFQERQIIKVHPFLKFWSQKPIVQKPVKP